MIATPGATPTACGTVGGTVSYTLDGRGVIRTQRKRASSTHRQKTIRNIFGGLAQQWSLSISTGAKTDWQTYAAAVAQTSGGCHPRTINGYQQFLRANLARANKTSRGLTNGTDTRNLARPATADLGQPAASVALSIPGGGNFRTDVTLAAPAPGPGQALVYIQSPLPKNAKRARNPWHLASVGTFATGQTTITEVSQFTDPQFWAAAWTYEAGSALGVKVRISYNDGRFAEALRTTVVAT